MAVTERTLENFPSNPRITDTHLAQLYFEFNIVARGRAERRQKHEQIMGHTAAQSH